jgi:hypothetical protein
MRLPFSRSGKPASPPDALNPHCANCGNPLAVGQDWCLDCGTAVRGRLGGPGVGSSIGVVGLTLLLVLGAVAAAYAALNSDSNKAVKTPPAAVAGVSAPATPDVGTTAPGTAGATGSAGAVVTTPILPSTPVPLPALPKIPGVTPRPGVRVGTPAAAAPVVSKPPGTTATPKPTVATPTTPPTVTTPTSTGTTAPAATPGTTTAAKNAILLDTDAASTYNPYSLPTSSFADPAKAIDGDLTTSWTYQLDPTSAGKTLVGVAIDLKAPQAVRAIKITTPTPGMTVEFYGVTGSSEPSSITDPAWLHLANRRAIKPSTSVILKTQGKSFRYLLVWITHAPSGVTAGTVGISEISVLT